MAATAKIFLQSGIKYIPQMDFSVTMSDNAGVEATQSFLARKKDLGVGGNLDLFKRGTRAEALDPNTPVLYRNLTVKEFPHEDEAPGIIRIRVTYTGYLYSKGGSSGEEATVPTYSLVGNLEESPLQEFDAWRDLSDASKERLTWLMDSSLGFVFSLTEGKYGKMDLESADGNEDSFRALDTGGGSKWAVPTGDELTFAKMIAEGRTTGKKPSWTYTVREESETGFTSAQLAKLGKIVANPPGNPINPGPDWTWMLVGPQQEQSGDNRFFKDLQFLLIPDNEENQMLYK